MTILLKLNDNSFWTYADNSAFATEGFDFVRVKKKRFLFWQWWVKDFNETWNVRHYDEFEIYEDR